MTLEEAIAHLDEPLGDKNRDWGCEECKQEHMQLREWLVELRERRAADAVPDRWISVEEQLPDAYKLVMTFTRSGRCVLAALYENFGAWFELWAGTRVDVTHWMPLPTPPSCEVSTEGGDN